MAANISPLKTKVVLVKVTPYNSVQYALDFVQYAENIARLLQCKVALNHSPEFKSLNPKPSAAQLFGILRPPFEQTSKNSVLCNAEYQISSI